MFGKRKPKKTTSRMGRVGLERLEDRTLLTGNCTAILDVTGTLNITGDIGNNALSIITSPAEPTEEIRVIGDAMSLTTVNGATFADFDVSAVTNLNVKYLNGKDSLKLIGPWPLILGQPPVLGNITVNAGTGSDTYFQGAVDANSVTLNYAGKLTATLTSAGFPAGTNELIGSLSSTSHGADSISLIGTHIGTANISAGGGSSVTITNSAGHISQIGVLTDVQADGADKFSMTNTKLAQTSVTLGKGAVSLVADSDLFVDATSFSVSAGGTMGGPATVDVSGDTFVNGPVSLTVGNGPTVADGTDTDLIMTVKFNANSDGGNATVKVGDNYLLVQADNDGVAGNLSVTAGNDLLGDNDNGDGDGAVLDASGDGVGGLMSVTGGNALFEELALGDVAGALAVVAGNNDALVAVAGTVSGAATVTVGTGAGDVEVDINLSFSSLTVTVGNGAGLVDVLGNLGVEALSVTTGTAGTVHVDGNLTESLTVKTGAVGLLTVSGNAAVDTDADGDPADGNISVTAASGTTAVVMDSDFAINNATVKIGTGLSSFQLTKSTIGNNATVTIAEADSDFVTTLLDNDSIGFATGFGNLSMSLGTALANGGKASLASNIMLIGTTDGVTPDGPVSVSNQMTIALSNGVNAVAAANFTDFFGDIFLGAGGANTYFDLGGNGPYTVHNFAGIGV
jgi:hypothetical protein